jgi:hypothetical protein
MSPHVTDHLDDYLHDLLPPGEAVRVERHLADCSDCRTALDAARRRQAALVAALPPVEPPPELVPATLARIAADAPRRRRWKRRALAIMFGPLAAAAVVLIALQAYYNNLHASPANLEVLGQRALLAGSPAALRVRLSDGRTHAPLAGVPVTIELRERGAGPFVSLARFTTDGRGSGAPTFQVPDWADGSAELRVTAATGREPEVLTEPVQLRRTAKLMLSTDKPVYQPGQTIHLRALTLRRPDLKPVADTAATFTVTDPKGNVVFKHAGRTSRFGITAADCPLAAEIIEGPYTIRCQVGDTDSSVTVDVQKYVLPKFKIDVQFDRPYYQPGQKVQVKVRANYFFGKPVGGGTLDVEVRLNDPTGPLIGKYGLRTEADGSAGVEFLLPEALPGRPQDGGDARLLVTATLRDTAGQRQARSASRAVTAAPFKLDVIPENGTLVPGVANRVYVYAGTPDGRPAKVRGTLKVGPETFPLTTNELGVGSFVFTPQAGGDYQLQIEATDDQGHSLRRTQMIAADAAPDNFLVRTDKAVYTGGDTLHLTALGGGNEPVFVDLIRDGQTVSTATVDMTNGQGQLAFDLSPDWAGTLELCAYRFNAQGFPVRKLRTFYVRPAAQLQLRASTDKPEYRPGETAKLTLALTDDKGRPTPGALSLAAVDEAVFSVLEQMPGMERTFYLLEKDLLQPVYAIYPWSPDGPDAPPRVEFEQALFARTTRTVGPQPGAERVVTRTVERDGRLMTEQRIESDPSGLIGGPHTLALNTYAAKVRDVLARKDLGLEQVFAGMRWLAVVASGALYLGLWLTFGERLVGKIVLGGLTAAALLLALVYLGAPEIRETAMRTKSAMKGEAMPTAMAMPPAPAEAAPPGSPDEPGGPPVRVREKFPETLLWRPEVVTDDQGRATLDVELADSITTWRLGASAVTADGRLGGLQTGVRVFQPFFVDLNLPVALTRGDEVTLPVVVSSYLPRPQTVELTLDDAPWLERTGGAVQRVELKPNEVRSVPYRLRVRQVGLQQLQVTARGEGVADAVRRQVEVVPDGRRVEQVVNGTLQEPVNVTLNVPENAIEGSTKAIVKLYPSSFSQLIEGLDAIFQMPSGCFEQTSSTTYPNVLALDYLKRTGKASPQVEAKARQYVHLGYQRLISFEVPGGGFDWYGRPPAHVALTAYGLMEFGDMARVHDVDPNLIARTRNWLIRRRQPDGSWPDDGRFQTAVAGVSDPGHSPRLRTTAYVAWAVFGSPDADADPRPTLDFLLAHRPESITDPNVLALVCNALLALDAKHPSVPAYLDRLDALKKSSPDGTRAWWELPAGARTPFYGAGLSGGVETTALAALAFLKAGDRPGTVRQALTWLVGQKDANGTWHSTQATVLALKALLAGTSKPLGGESERRIEVALDGQPVRTVTIPADQGDVMVQFDLSGQLKPGAQRLTLTERSQTAAGFQVAFRYHVPGDAPPPAAEPLSVALAYDRDTLAVGDALTATATVTNRLPVAAPMVMLDLPIPAGFTVEAEAFQRLVQNGTIGRFQATPRQVLVYLRGLESNRPLTLKYTLRPTMPVTVTVPAARAYEYYDPAKEGRSAAQKLTVTARR